jgi:hypothetical protein
MSFQPEGTPPPDPAELLAQGQQAAALERPANMPPPPYEPGEIVAVLTLDEKQAWVLMVLLGAYKDVQNDWWDIYRAAWDVRRRVAEALGYK